MDKSRWALVRFAGYALVMGAVLEGVVLIQQTMPGSNRLFREGHIVEWTQLGLLLASGVILLAASTKFSSSRQLYRIMAFLPLMAAVRELDSVFDKVFGKGIWGLICIAIGLVCIFLAVHWRTALKDQIRTLVSQRSFGYMASSVILILVISRITGQQVFWKAYLEPEAYTRDVPRAVEESGELAGYLLLFFGVLEAYFTRRRDVPVNSRGATVEKELVGAER